ncbi:MAG: hypothetical protein GC154_20665 [bacterium]|nr:hypothetical protein [bacterium]
MAKAQHLVLFQRMDDRLVWLEASSDRGVSRVVCAGAEPLEGGVDGLHSAVEAAARRLRLGLMTRYDVVLTAPNHLLTARHMETPPTDEDAMRDLVAFEVSEALQVPIEDVAWDYWSSPRRETGEIGRLLWFAARRSILEQWLSVWPNNLMPPSQIAPSVWALYEYGLRMEGGPFRQPAILIHREGDRAEIALADSQAIYYTRSVSLRSSVEEDESSEARMRRLNAEVERTLSFMSGRVMDGELRGMALIGFNGSAGPLESLAAERSLTVYHVTLDDLKGAFESAGDGLTPDHASLLAIASSRLRSGEEGVNLLPRDEVAASGWGSPLWEAARPSKPFIQRVGGLAAAILLVWIVGSIWFGRAVEARLEEGANLIKLAERLQAEETALRAMKNQNVDMAGIMIFLSTILPDKILVKNFQLSASDGIHMSLTGGNNQSALEIIEKMNASPYFRDVITDRAVAEREGIVIYLEGKVIPGARG